MIDRAVDAIARGEVIGLPTDTVYGLGVDPIDEGAVGKLFDLKGRPPNKPVGLLVASAEQAAEICDFSEVAVELANAHWPGALTLILEPTVVMADWVGDKQRRTIGVRVPDHEVARQLLERTGPLAVTSANRSGEPEALDADSARRVFGGEVAVYVPGEAVGGQASTVVDLTGPRPTVLRQGPVSI